MKRAILIGLTVLAFGLSSVFAQEPPKDNPIPPSKAKLQIEETAFKFGYVPNDATVSHLFMMYSRGEDSLKILRVRPG